MTRKHSPSTGADIAAEVLDYAFSTATKGWLDEETHFRSDPTLSTPIPTLVDIFAAMRQLNTSTSEIHEPPLSLQLDLCSLAAIKHAGNFIGHLIDPLSVADEFSSLTTAKDSIEKASLLAHLRLMSHIPEEQIYAGLKPQRTTDNSIEIEQQVAPYVATLPPEKRARYLFDKLIDNATFGVVDDWPSENMMIYLHIADNYPDLLPTALKLDLLELGYVHQALIGVNFEIAQKFTDKKEEDMDHLHTTLERAIGFLEDKIKATVLPEDPSVSTLEIA
ncbi:hypothetical protein COU88_01050 [Candidatus Roizmanbacteria bacterium CG10_big_fil_rev_8_21_14_0_10_39_6]|uniref:Uncharacterized protein n=1 Tax=Candidatus Roizmanbacteria bacterium CG10_big_fil_rev_8_21_14_0_10_39_6 TaxID=1974853 RepID=A0A2M8KT97_9BACT|nr:MAG: hypothetical protein COU88_01050 [Candidatus Roizmanbacteria bacterium CG10_big_fil_rev_8_21_14_0_10_39_6]